ncbi:FAD:protein FMN transferase [Aquicoccus sp. SCR17]|nr:FAD:protein FMN transferase [Carideicomes alvinocaridis]
MSERRNMVLIDPAVPERLAAPGARLVQASGETMGTCWRLRCWAEPGHPDPAGVVAGACDEAIALFSPWDAGSAISGFNHAGRGWYLLPPALWRLLQDSLQVARLSGGALDPALGRLADLWGFGPSGPVRRPPSRAALEAARACSGLKHLRLGQGGRAWQPGGLWLDFGGIAKGWAVDLVSRRLTEAGLGVHMIEIGGEIAARGLSPQGRPWWIELEAPPGSDLPRALVALHRGAIAGSGSWRRRARPAGQGWSHAIDPATGRPVEGAVLSVHVLHPRADLADAWASALMVLPPEDGLARAKAAGLAAILTLQEAAGRITRRSTGLSDWLDTAEDAPRPEVAEA